MCPHIFPFTGPPRGEARLQEDCPVPSPPPGGQGQLRAPLRLGAQPRHDDPRRRPGGRRAVPVHRLSRR